MKNIIKINKTDLEDWIARLNNLQKCNMNPEACTHDENDRGQHVPFDYASIDMTLDQVISEMKQTLS